MAPGQTFLDLTFGSGGHTSRLLDACGDCVVVAADADAKSYEAAAEMAGRYPGGALVPLRARFSSSKDIWDWVRILGPSLGRFLVTAVQALLSKGHVRMTSAKFSDF